MPSPEGLGGLLGGGISGTHQRSPYGQLPFSVAGGLGGQLQGLQRAFGFGPANPRQAASLEKLLGRGGPLAGLANDVRGFSGSVVPEAQAAGNTIAARGSEAFTSLTQQIATMLGDVNQARGGAQTLFREAFDPASQTPFYNEAFRRALEPERAAAAGRGLLDSGAGQQGEDELARRLSVDFAGQQQQLQEAAIPALTNVGQAGVGAAGVGLEAVPQLAQALSQQFGLPLQASGALMSLLTNPQQGLQQLLGQTGPVQTPFSAKGTGKGG